MKNIYAMTEKQDDGTFTTVIVCRNYDVASLSDLFNSLKDEADLSVHLDLPVIRELEDPEFMAELDRRVEDVQNGTIKTSSWEELIASIDMDGETCG